MNLKTYQAASMAEALAAVKRDLGRDAVILHTRCFRKGGFLRFGGRQMWEITASRNVNVPERKVRPSIPAAIQLPQPKLAPQARPQRQGGESSVAVIDGPAEVPGLYGYAPARTQPQSEDNQLTHQVRALTEIVEKLVRRNDDASKSPVPEELFETYLELIQQEVAEDIAKELVEKIRSQLTGEQLRDKSLIRQKLMEFIASMIPTAISEASAALGRPRVIALIGPTGVGKTTTIAKLAANLKLRQGRRVGLITIDTYRIAAVDQLRTYAQIIDVPLKVVMTPPELAEAIAEMQDVDDVLIDTAGRSQNDTVRLAQLKEFLRAAAPDEVHLVLSTTANPKNVQAALGRFSSLGVDRVILTKLDEAVSFGMILNVVRQMNAALSYVTMGQDVPDDIEVSHGRRIAEMIVGGSSSC